MCLRQVGIGGLMVAMCGGVAVGALPDLTVTAVGSVPLTAGEAGAAELSGLAHVGGDEWLAVADGSGELFTLTIQLNGTTGAITSAEVISGSALAEAGDLEGVAYDPVTGSAWIADEADPAIRRHDLTTGAVLQTLTLPEVFNNVRNNYSLESLTRNPVTGALWTANEEALSVDGPISTTDAGTVVRLQQFDATGAPAGQWAYVTEKIRAVSDSVAGERSGVSDLVALPDGRLLVLEREYAAALPPFVNRLYLVNFDGASEVSSLDGLQNETYTPVMKTLLWEQTFWFENYEGIGLGPKLDDGSFSLLLVSDDGGNALAQQRLYALRISGVIPEPSGVLPLMGGLMGWLLRRSM